MDDPELDCTDGAHPAWWRGNAAGVWGMCQRINEALDEPIEQVRRGVMQDIPQQTRERVLKLREQLAAKDAENLRLRKALETISLRDWVSGGCVIGGNDQLPDKDTQRFYQGYNSGINSQFNKTAGIAREALGGVSEEARGASRADE